MAERGSGANRAEVRAPRRKVSSWKVGTGCVADRPPTRKPPKAAARIATRAAPPISERRLRFEGLNTVESELSWPTAADPLESVASTDCREEDDWRSRCRRLRSTRISAAV